MPQPDYKAAAGYALDLLRKNLSPDLTYHNLWHTQHDIIPSVLRLAELCRMGADDRGLLLVAAAYHDVGFTETYNEHEQAGARILIQVLPDFGFSAAQIDRLANLVLATRLPQSPADLMEEILADSDLDVLGRKDFLERNEALRQEISTFRKPVARRSWLEGQIGFLQEHVYFTSEAQTLREAGKRRNIALITETLQGSID